MTLLTEAQPAPAGPTAPDLSLERAVPMFLEYLRGYRSCSPLSIRSYAADLRYFQDFLASRGPLPPPSEITRQTVVQFAVTLSHWSPVTVRRKLSCLCSFFSFLQDMGYVSGNPARRLPLPKQERRMPVTLSEEQARQLIAAAELPWHRCLVVMLLATGMRRSELLQVTLEDIDAQNRQLLVHGKGAKQRTLPLTRQALAAIAGYLPHRPSTQSRRLLVNERGSGQDPRLQEVDIVRTHTEVRRELREVGRLVLIVVGILGEVGLRLRLRHRPKPESNHSRRASQHHFSP